MHAITWKRAILRVFSPRLSKGWFCLNRTAKNTAIYFVGTVLMGAFGFINTMLLTRVLDEKVYAMYGLLTTFVTATTTLVAFGFDSAYARFYYKHDTKQVAFLIKNLAVPLGLFAILILVLLEPNQYFLTYIFGERLPIFSALVLLGYVFFFLVHRFTQLTVRMEEKAANYVASNFIGRCGFALIVLLVFLMAHNVGFNWVLLSFLFSSALATGINLWVVCRICNSVNEQGQAVGKRDLFSYGFPIMINNLLILVMPLIEKLIIRDLAGWEVLGVYTAAAVFQTVVLLLLNTIDNIWNPLVFKHCDEPQKFKPIMHNFGLAVSVIVVLGFAACVLLRRWLVLLLGADYHSVYIIAPAICFGTCFRLVTMVYSAGIHIAKKTVHFIVEPIIQMVLSLALCFCLIKPMGLIGVGIAVTTSVIVSRIYRMAIGLRLYDTGTSEHKMWLLMGVCTAVSIASLFFTSLIADVVMFVVLMVAMLSILNKDLIQVIRTTKSLLMSKKAVKKEER